MVYGTISAEGTQYKGLFTALKRNPRTDDLTKSAVVNISFYESQASWYSKEVVKKLLSPRYRINSKDAPRAIGISFDVSKMKGMDIKRIKIRFRDTTIQQIVNYLKEIIAEGDGYFKDKDYDSALENYNLVFEKIKKKLPPSKQKKLRKFTNLVNKRKDIIFTVKSRKTEARADEYYTRFQFENADTEYSIALTLLKKVQNKKAKDYRKYTKSLKNKKRMAQKTGESHFVNKVKSFCDRIDFFNIKDEEDSAHSAFDEAKGFFIESKFNFNKEAKKLLNERAALLKKDKIPDKINKDFIATYNFKKGVTNIKGTKIIGGIEFIAIKGGCFMMGSNSGRKNEKPVHWVCVDSFWMGKYEITQGQYKRIMNAEPWSKKGYVQEGDNYPAVYVSWHKATEFSYKFGQLYNVNARLPFEAEWEYAARAGTKTEYSFGNSESQLGKYAWYDKNADEVGEDYAHLVGQKKPNPWGLYDMHGNVVEWCRDWYGKDYYSESPGRNPKGPSSGKFCVLRGGSFNNHYSFSLRSANRNDSRPVKRSSYLGLRLVLSSPE